MKIFLIVIGMMIASVSNSFGQSCTDTTESLAHMQVRFIELIDDAGESVLLRVKVADESAEQSAGFQHICPDTIESTAILFIFEHPKQPLFHMNNVHANLDIAFMDIEGVIGDVQLMSEEFSTGKRKLYPSTVEAKYALEVREGYFNEHNISANHSRMKIND